MSVCVHSAHNPTLMERKYRKQPHFCRFNFVEALPTGVGEILIFVPDGAEKMPWQDYELRVVRLK
jgi:hypothetical protein